ncbi:enolase C-terminal domain-like protein [Chelatococcus sp.]|uniref:enolase C-terminal domain-like protein n=1 Tax=Chelatococcus sp. TaxID=1953771 RepID=UPI0025B967D1|nr:enolase C-terminal domain-like protein [Chelatococcus sp.]
MSHIAEVKVTPIAFRDAPLLNAAGLHEPWAIRSVLEVVLKDGTVGLSETYGDAITIELLRACGDDLIGLDIYDRNGLKRRVASTLQRLAPPTADVSPRTASVTLLPRIFGAFEVAAFDAVGHLTGRPVYDLLGGACRRDVPFSAYLFYKFSRHELVKDGWSDPWGNVQSPEEMVREAREMVRRHGFQSLKFKAGVFEPALEVETLRALRAAFPQAPLRIDPNGAWTVETTLRMLPDFEELLEYLEDPTMTIDGMAAVQAKTSLPLATNMCTVAFDHVPETIAKGAVRVILADHHFWGGLEATKELAAICRTWGIGLSMHSNSHLGISLMAMAHLAAATPNLTYACDTHYPWEEDEIVEGGTIPFIDGCVRVSDKPGLGVALDRDALAKLHDNWRSCGIIARDDAAELRKYWPDWSSHRPRW